MPKMKSNSAAKKRFRRTPTGKIMRGCTHHSHILTKKSAKRRRRLRQGTVVSATDAKRIRRALGG
jgi:large subunit ribosomal protein L35